MKWHRRSTRRPSGGRQRPGRKKRKHELGRDSAETSIGEHRLKVVDVKGGGEKARLLGTDKANVTMDGETKEAEILNVVENSANPNYARRDIITRGAVIETSEGDARVTSRPGQDGVVNAVSIE